MSGTRMCNGIRTQLQDNMDIRNWWKDVRHWGKNFQVTFPSDFVLSSSPVKFYPPLTGPSNSFRNLMKVDLKLGVEYVRTLALKRVPKINISLSKVVPKYSPCWIYVCKHIAHLAMDFGSVAFAEGFLSSQMSRFQGRGSSNFHFIHTILTLMRRKQSN